LPENDFTVENVGEKKHGNQATGESGGKIREHVTTKGGGGLARGK